MRKMKAALLTGMLLCMQFLWAQTTVTGRVADARDGSPLPGVTVTVKNTNLSTVTGADGAFSLNAPENSTLVFSYVGYQNLEQPASGTMSVGLSRSENALSEVVVVGYGTRIRRNVTASISRVTNPIFRTSRYHPLNQHCKAVLPGVYQPGKR